MVSHLQGLFRPFLGSVCLLSPTVASNSAVADVDPSWFLDLIDAGGTARDDVGAHLSPARHPQSGFLAFSFDDATQGDLRLARRDATGGDFVLAQHRTSVSLPVVTR